MKRFLLTIILILSVAYSKCYSQDERNQIVIISEYGEKSPSQAGMEKLDFGYGYEMGQRTSSTALRANTHELFLRFKFGQGKANNETQKQDNNNKSR